MTVRLSALWLGLLFLLVSQSAAWACPVCVFGSDQTRTAFIVTTAIMSAVPLALIGGIVLWLRQQSRQNDTDGSMG